MRLLPPLAALFACAPLSAGALDSSGPPAERRGPVTLPQLTLDEIVSTGAMSEASVASRVGGRPRPLSDRFADAPSLPDFGTPTNGDWTSVVQAAEASAAITVYLPAGTYPTRLSDYQAVNKIYFGPGRLKFGNNTAAGFRSFLTTYPGAADATTLQTLMASVDTRKMVSSTYSYVGPGATGPSGNSYKLLLGTAQTLRAYEYAAGFQTNPNNQSGGRSGTAVDVKYIRHNGQGDLGAGYNNVAISGDTPKATHFLAKPAASLTTGGDIVANTKSADGKYLQDNEQNFYDNGTAAAVGSRVRHYHRTNMGNSLGQVWVNDWIFGPNAPGVAADCAYCVQDNWRRGLDFSAADFSLGQQAAIVLPPGARTYFGGYARGDTIGLRSISTSLGFAAQWMDRTGHLHVTANLEGGAPGKTVVFDGLPSAATGLPDGGLWRDPNTGVIRAASGDGGDGSWRAWTPTVTVDDGTSKATTVAARYEQSGKTLSGFLKLAVATPEAGRPVHAAYISLPAGTKIREGCVAVGRDTGASRTVFLSADNGNSKFTLVSGGGATLGPAAGTSTIVAVSFRCEIF